VDAKRGFAGIDAARLPPGVSLYRGKVRDVLDTRDSLVLVTTDRVSAFDRNLGVLPGKGEILNQISLYWFRQTSDLVPNHLLGEVSSRAIRARKAQVLPVEVIVRGYLTGSAWRDWSKGILTPGLEDLDRTQSWKPHQKLPEPRVTPSTKAVQGEHDEPISHAQIVERGLVPKELWQQVVSTALAVYERGRSILADRGLLLVDAKYEFGLVDGRLVLVDELHTPDCSRFWYAEDYQSAFTAGREPRKLDKEYLRAWLLEQGFSGEGSPPPIPDAVWETTLERYEEAFRLITGASFSPSSDSPEAQTRLILSSL
jgi:phosphoribosylaminoimidazole-succinocarboxamide synthase